MRRHILIAPGPFKESISAAAAASAMERGLRRSIPDTALSRLPLCDGGSGFVDTILECYGGRKVSCRVNGPLGDPVHAFFGVAERHGKRIGLIESAAAAGLTLVPPERRNPEIASTRGVGELILAALDEGCTELIVGCGDSGTIDGGSGMARALGVRFVDKSRSELGPGGANLANLDAIELGGVDRRLAGVDIIAAVNPRSLLCGACGTARIFGPQKGADWSGVLRIEAGLEKMAQVVQRDLGRDVARIPGGGGAGGLGAGLHAFFGARLTDRMPLVLELVGFDRHLAGAQLVITGEGRLDDSSVGKVAGYVARRARDFGIPAVAIVGGIQVRTPACPRDVDIALPICPGPLTLQESIANAAELLEDAAERLGRMLTIGGLIRSSRARVSVSRLRRMELSKPVAA